MSLLNEIDFMTLYYSLFMGFVFTFPAYLITAGIAGSKERKEAALLKAISRGHVVTAVYKKHLSSSVPVPASKGHKTSSALYEYEYKGKTYRYHYSNDNLPNTLKLYFLKNPRKATVRSSLIDSEIDWLQVYVIVSAVIWGIYTICGIQI